MGAVAEQILRISRDRTSPTYLSEEELARYVDEPNRFVYIYDGDRVDPVVEVTDPADLWADGADVYGFTMAGRYERNAYEQVVSVPVEEILRRSPLAPDDFPLSQIKVVAVAAQHTGQGIGSTLTGNVFVPLLEDPPVTAMIWERESPANVRLAEQYANNRVETFEDYFPDDWKCPECGFDAECECDATLYAWFADERRHALTDTADAAPA